MKTTTLKSIGLGILAGVVSLWVVGCATCCRDTSGQRYDDAKVAAIQRGVTTEAELVQWFGPPVSRLMGPDGAKGLNWKFAGQTACSGPSGKLEVRLDPQGKVVSYSASASRK